MKNTSMLLLYIWVFSNFAFAASEFDDFDDEFGDFYADTDFISIATGSKTSLDKAPAIASVITAEQIKKIGATHLDEVLELIPGLHVTASTVSRLDPVYSIRGIQTGFNPQVLVLVNGTEFKNSFSGGLPYTFRLPATNIERVEVIRGPGSAVYGADAYSGVINIVLKKHHENPGFSIGGRAGSFRSKDAWLHAGKQWGELSVGFAIENQTSEGDVSRVAETDLQSVFDGIFNTNASLAPAPLQTQYDILDTHLLAAYKGFTFENWWWKQNHGGLGAGGAQTIDMSGYQDVSEYRAKASYSADLGGEWSVKIQASYLDVDSNSYFVLFPAGSVLPIGEDGNLNFTDTVGLVNFSDGYIGNPQTKHRDTRAEMSVNYSGYEDHDIRLSVGWFKQEHHAEEFKNFGPGVIDGSESTVDGSLTDVTGTPYIFIPNIHRTNQHFVFQDIWKLARDWELTTGLRYDKFSAFGDTVNPRLALVWEAAHNLTVKALYGSAFRAPSFSEQFQQNNPSALGNVDVKPETIDTFELGVNYQSSFSTRLSANIYSYKAEDLIARGPVDGTSVLMTDNLSGQDGIGVEFEIDLKLERLELQGNFSIQSVEASLTQEDTPLIPQRTAFLGVFYDLSDRFNLSFVNHWISGRQRASNDSRTPIDDYFLVNLSSIYNVTDNILAKLSVKNMLDETIYEPSTGSISNDYQMPSRSLWLEFEYKHGL